MGFSEIVGPSPIIDIFWTALVSKQVLSLTFFFLTRYKLRVISMMVLEWAWLVSCNPRYGLMLEN